MKKVSKKRRRDRAKAQAEKQAAELEWRRGKKKRSW